MMTVLSILAAIGALSIVALTAAAIIAARRARARARWIGI
jgi:hypothetical protein